MRPGELTLKFSTRARQDLRLIWEHGVDMWGQELAEAYHKKLKKKLAHLLQFPNAGRKRPELGAGCFSLVAEKHLIFYSISEPNIYILGVVHQRMDISLYFQ